jgi:hypothetical protein
MMLILMFTLMTGVLVAFVEKRKRAPCEPVRRFALSGIYLWFVCAACLCNFKVPRYAIFLGVQPAVSKAAWQTSSYAVANVPPRATIRGG